MSENESIKRQVGMLEDEKKEFEVTNQELRQENQRLKVQSLDKSKYEEWGAEELVHWIVSIDPEVYSQYEEALRKTFQAEAVGGDCIDAIDANDVKGWGIVNFKHRKRLMQEINRLKDRNKSKAAMLHEGANAHTAYI